MCGQAYHVRFFSVILLIGVLGSPSSSHAQLTAPSQFTPQTLRPLSRPRDPGIVLSEPSAEAIPRGAENLSVAVGDVRVEGGFAELSGSTNEWTRRIAGQSLTVAQIYASAAALEKLYSAAGYVLARVVVPPQKLVDHGSLRIVVVDGFIESVDTAGVPERARGAVAARTRALVGQHHLTLGQVERSLLLAGEVAGLTLRSTLMRGQSVGGVKLVLEGEHRLVTGSVAGDDMLVSSLGTWQLRGSVAVNSALGFGEQVYGTLGLGKDIQAATEGQSPLVVYGGGVVVPVGDDGLTINPEYTHTTTQTAPTPGVPASMGTFDRVALRLRNPLILTRKQSLFLNVSLEQVNQQVSAPQFGVTLNDDSYRVIRTGADYATTLPSGAGLQTGAVVSKGIGGRSAFDAMTSGVPLSRAGAGPDFTKVTGNIRVSQLLPEGFRLDVVGSGQVSMGQPMLRPEQATLDGSDAVSSFASGTFTADQAAILRGELIRQMAAGFGTINGTVSPYLFGAIGHGWLVNASAVEQSSINAGAVGIGVRVRVETAANAPVTTLGVEVGKRFTDVLGVRQGWRANIVASAVY